MSHPMEARAPRMGWRKCVHCGGKCFVEKALITPEHEDARDCVKRLSKRIKRMERALERADDYEPNGKDSKERPMDDPVERAARTWEEHALYAVERHPNAFGRWVASQCRKWAAQVRKEFGNG